MTTQLSIIIPVYNALPYLEECLDSIFSQGADQNLFEVIAVDDGSTDGSGAYCDRVAESQANFTVIHTENSGGASRPRNIALGVAQGQYIFFCDADDRMCPGSIQGMLRHAAETGCDLGLFKIDRSDWDGGDYAGLFNESLCRVPLNYRPLASFFGPCRLVKLSLLRDNGIFFDERQHPEDWCFALQCYIKAQNICTFGDQTYYKYVKRDDGKSLTLGNLSDTAGDWASRIAMFRDYLGHCQNNGLSPEEYPWFYRRAFSMLVARMARIIRDDNAGALYARFRELLLPVYSEQVRSSLPFRNLPALDAFMEGRPVDELQSLLAIRSNGVDVDFAKDESGSLSYVLSPVGDQGVTRTVPFPVPPNGSYGPDLLRPGFKKFAVDEACLDDAGLHLRGRAFCLKRTEAEFSAVRLVAQAGKKGEPLPVEVAVEDLEASVAYDKVSYVHFAWSVCVSPELVAQAAGGKSGKLHFDFEVSWADGSIVSSRLGHTFAAGAFDGYEGVCVRVPEGMLVGGFTARKNLLLECAVPVCRITALSWQGAVLHLEGTVSALDAVASDAHCCVMLEDVKGSGKPVSFAASVSEAGAAGAAGACVGAPGAAGAGAAWSCAVDLGVLLKEGLGYKRFFWKPKGKSCWQFAFVIGDGDCAEKISFGRQRPKGSLAVFKQGAQSIGRCKVAPGQTKDRCLCIETAGK